MSECAINQQQCAKNLKTYSFDIFDTLFTRRTAVPVGIFKIMQYKLGKESDCPDFIADNFFTLRTETELYLRKNRFNLFGAEDVTLDEIYDSLNSNYNLGSELTDKIKNLEIQLEINNVVPLRKNIELYKKLKSDKNNNVILISDMYLPEDVIRRMLIKADSCLEDAKLYLSCECNHKTKHYGSLYNYVKNSENISVKEWFHYGDNPHADIKRANECGISTKLLPQLGTSRIDNFLLNCAPKNCIIDAIAGASRLGRKSIMSEAYKLGLDITAPLLYSFVNYVLNNAIANNYLDLYFVARDGYILKVIADKIINKRNLKIKTHYLYGSRYAWRLANESNYDLLIDFIFDDFKYDREVTASVLAWKLKIDIAHIHRYFGDKLNKLSSDKKYRDLLKKNAEFKEFLIDCHNKKRQLLIKYMKQECGLNPHNIVLVDLDGSGRTNDCLQSVLSEDMNCVIHSYYFLQFFNTEQSDKSRKYSYFLSDSYFTNWIELLTCNVEGQCIGYEENSGIVKPILEPFRSDWMESWGFTEYIEGINAYVNNIVEFEDINGICISSYDFYMLLLNYIYSCQDKKLAETLGSVIHSENGREDTLQSAVPITLKECFLMLFGKKNILRENLSFLRIARSENFKRRLYEFYLKYGSLRKFLINITVIPKKELFEITFLGVKLKSKNVLRLISKLKGKN